MHIRTMLVVLTLLAGGASTVTFGQERPELVVELQKDTIYEGESVRYTVILNHVDDPTRPLLPKVEGLRIEEAGEQSLNFSQRININGRRTDIVRRGMAYAYQITPSRAGRFRIPAPEVNINGQTLKGRAVVLEAIGPEAQDIAMLNIEVDRERVYPMVPFTVKLILRIRALPSPHENRSPINVQREPPDLNLPWLRGLPGVTPTTDTERWLSPMRNPSSIFQQSGGIMINRIGLSFIGDPSTFTPPSRKVRIPRCPGNGASLLGVHPEAELYGRANGRIHVRAGHAQRHLRGRDRRERRVDWTRSLRDG